MRRFLVLTVTILLLFAVSCAHASMWEKGFPQVAGGLRLPDVGKAYEIDVEPNSFHVIHINFTKDSGIYGSFNVTKGNDITFLILDDEQLGLFVNLEPHRYYVAIEREPKDVFRFKPPKNATWHLVFNNRYSSNDKHIRLQIALDQTPPSVTCNVTNGMSYTSDTVARFVIEEAEFYLYVRTVVDGSEIDRDLTECMVTRHLGQ